jgi:hypothetical protein
MSKLQIVWTKRLCKAAANLANETETRKYREMTDADVKSRAREYCSLRAGRLLEPFQMEYTQCLLQRLDMDYDNPRASHVEFKAAWEEAYIDAQAEKHGIKDVM